MEGGVKAMKNKIRLLLSLAALLLAGCGQKESPPAEPRPVGTVETNDLEPEEGPSDVDGEVPQW